MRPDVFRASPLGASSATSDSAVVIFTPSYSFQNPGRSNYRPWNRDKDYYIAEVRLPITDDTDDREMVLAQFTAINKEVAG